MLTTRFSRCTPVVLLLAYFVAPSSTLAWRFRNACRDAKMPYSIRWDSLWHCNDTIKLVVSCHVLAIFVYWYVCSHLLPLVDFCLPYGQLDCRSRTKDSANAFSNY
jgi:hypothetical protein